MAAETLGTVHLQETARGATFFMFEKGDWPSLEPEDEDLVSGNCRIIVGYCRDRYSVFRALDCQTDSVSGD
jgi:hypothetical protein